MVVEKLKEKENRNKIEAVERVGTEERGVKKKLTVLQI